MLFFVPDEKVLSEWSLGIDSSTNNSKNKNKDLPDPNKHKNTDKWPILLIKYLLRKLCLNVLKNGYLTGKNILDS